MPRLNFVRTSRHGSDLQLLELNTSSQKELLLIQQNRQAVLGEMLDHIAHQWKQPLNSISLIIQDLESSASDGELSKEYIEKNLGKVMALLDHMAQTINVFREFYHPDKEKAVFSIKDSIDTACHFIGPMLRLHGIEVEFDVDLGVAAVGYSKEYAHRSRPDESSFFMAKEFAVNQLSSSPENHVGN